MTTFWQKHYGLKPQIFQPLMKTGARLLRILPGMAGLFIFFPVLAQTVHRQPNETAEMFIKRLIPDSTELAHPVVETTAWDTALKALIALYGYDNPEDLNTGFNEISGHLYLPIAPNIYRDISFGPLEENGGYPELLSVFFANADGDVDQELLVLCRYEQRHYDYDGAFYETFIFDNPGRENRLVFFKDLSEKFFGCECGWRNGKTKTAKYKTAREVKIKLSRMGYRQ